MKFLTAIYSDILKTMSACLVKDPARKDIIWEYTEFYHERICQMITAFWDQ